MKMRVFILFVLIACAYAAEEADQTAEQSKDKRQAQEGHHAQFMYRSAKKQEVAPVMEPQDDDKGSLRNRTTPSPIAEDESAKVERPTREKPDNADSDDQTKDQNKIDQPTPSVATEEAKDVTQLDAVPQVEIQHHALSVEDRQTPNLPPPRDGQSYTPEEFTSLIVQGFPVTPIPDYGSVSQQPGSLYGLTSTASPPLQYTPSPFSPPFSPNPYFSRNLPVTSTLPPALFGMNDNDQAKSAQTNLQAGLEQLRTRLGGARSLPPPKNSKAYTLEEYNSLVAAGYPVTPVPVAPLNLDISQSSQNDAQEYRPGQVFSLHPRELLELQPERKAPLGSSQLLQQLYSNPQQEHKQNLQPFYFLDPQSQSGRQVSSHAVISRPQFSFNGGEASVGAALSVSDTGANSDDALDQELLALLGQANVRPQEYRATQAPSAQSVAPQYQQVDRYVVKPSKKSSKLRSKVQSTPQPSPAPQQYLIETTNVQQQQQSQYRPTVQPQRLAQSLRYVPIQQSQQLDQFGYERPESQGLKIVPAPKLQPRAQFNYRITPQYQQQEAVPKYQQQEVAKQYRVVEVPRAQPIRQELRIPSSSVERPVTYLKRYPELEKQRSVKIYDPIESLTQQQAQQLFGEQFVLRPAYRTNEQRQRYELSAQSKSEQSRVAEATKAPHSAIYVSKNLPRQQKVRPQSSLKENLRFEQPSFDDINIEQHGQSLDEQRSHLPPPKNNKAYTPEEFAALVAAGYSVTPVPVSSINLEAAQSRSSIETVTAQPKRRPTQRRRNQYLPVRDDAP